jgi:hypothetical protein
MHKTGGQRMLNARITGLNRITETNVAQRNALVKQIWLARIAKRPNRAKVVL